MKKFFIILSAFLVILLIASYGVLNYRNQNEKILKLNKEYEQYYNKQILGTELISIINKTIDYNNKNETQKDNNGYYIDNNKNSIQIYVDFVYKNEIKQVKMEDIGKMGTESFIKVYSTQEFKCNKITYHEETKSVKDITFTEVINE